jgi:hypothetical protein
MTLDVRCNQRLTNRDHANDSWFDQITLCMNCLFNIERASREMLNAVRKRRVNLQKCEYESQMIFLDITFKWSFHKRIKNSWKNDSRSTLFIWFWLKSFEISSIWIWLETISFETCLIFCSSRQSFSYVYALKTQSESISSRFRHK